MRTKIIVLLITIVALGAGLFAWFVLRSDTSSTSQDRDQGQNQQRDKDTAETPDSIHLNITQDSLLLAQQNKSLQVAIRDVDYQAIARVEYLLDGKLAGYSTTPPFSVDIDLSSLTSGQHVIQAIAYFVNGDAVKSDMFYFVIMNDGQVDSDGSRSQRIVRQSNSIGSINKDAQNGSGSNSGNTGGGTTNPGGDPGEEPEEPGEDPDTPWPDEPPAAICGNTSLLSGPSSAPADAIVLPAGDNSNVNLELPNKTYWFAPGIHTLGNDPLSQIEPGENSTYVGAPGAIIDGQGINRYVLTQHAENVTVHYLTIQNFNTPQNEGAVNHDSGDGWTIEYNTIRDNGGAGVFGGSDNVIRYNCLKDNGQYGFQVFQNESPPTNVLLDHNEVAGNNTDDWEAQIEGCGCTGGGKFWEASNITITNNWVHDNLSVGLWADTNDNDFLIENNYIADNNGQGIFYEISYNMIVRGNTFLRNALVDGPGNPSFPTGAIYLSEAGGDSRIPARTSSIEIYDNQFIDNWSGVILWENADRFCNSPANTSTGTCTLGNPDATLTTCNDPALGGLIDEEPYYSDCRWKTNNVTVHDNVFSLDRSEITDCFTSKGCGYQGIFSNVGTFPSWSPYKGDVIQKDITFNQNNHFSDNTYIGDWAFRAQTENTLYNFALWQLPPFNQDVGSTYNGKDHMVVANAIDEDTSTLENSIGEWTNWFSANATRSNEEAHTGSYSLKAEITAAFGWGIQLDLSRGYPITPAEKEVSFWAKLGTGTNIGTRLSVDWLDENGASILADPDTVPLAPLTTEWQKASAVFTPPPGARSANIYFSNATGSAGNTLYMDDIVIADTE